MRHKSTSSSGSALLLVLWSLVLLSMSVFGVVEIVETSVTHASHLEAQAQARALAMSGLAVALHPEMSKADSLLQQNPAGTQKWEVTMHGEASRLNLNYVLVHGHREILTRLFGSWGVEAGQAEAVTENLYNWIAPDDQASDHGATRADYIKAGLTHLPTGRPFASLAEARQVIGMDQIEKARPDWQDAFTLWSEGPLDVNEASPELLAAVLNVPVTEAKVVVEKRNGKDGVAETDDDVPVADADALKHGFGLGDGLFKSLADEVTFSDAVRRIESIGKDHDVSVTISAVVRLQTSPPEFLQWTEL